MNSGPFHVLLVEDDPHDTLLIVQALGDEPQYRLHAVEDGAQALAYLHGDYIAHGDPLPDMILLDLRLPRCNGLELLAEIKAHDDFKHIPSIVLTNSALPHDINTSYALHANAYVQKPFNPVQFRQAIRQILDFWLNTVTLPQR